MIFITDSSCYQTAVKYALIQHINRIKKIENLIIMVKIGNEFHFKDLGEIISYSNWFDLMRLLVNNPDQKIFASNIYHVIVSFFSKILKRKKIYFWVQGILPEESFLRNKSNLKYFILSFIEGICLLVSDKWLVVSNEMFKFLSKKYKIYSKPYFVIPCTSRFTPQNIPVKEQGSFVYVGGMSSWQCIDETLSIYNKIFLKRPNTKFYLVTADVETARTKILPYRNLPIEIKTFIQPEELEFFLKTMEFGFLIRADIPVNHVASPIKLAEYLSCGVHVIISAAVKDYAPLVSREGAGIILQTIDAPISTDFHPDPERSIKLYLNHFSSDIKLEEVQRFFS